MIVHRLVFLFVTFSSSSSFGFKSIIKEKKRTKDNRRLFKDFWTWQWNRFVRERWRKREKTDQILFHRNSDYQINHQPLHHLDHSCSNRFLINSYWSIFALCWLLIVFRCLEDIITRYFEMIKSNRSITMKSQSSLSACWKLTNDSLYGHSIRWESWPSLQHSHRLGDRFDQNERKMCSSSRLLTSTLNQLVEYLYWFLLILNKKRIIRFLHWSMQMRCVEDNEVQQTVKKSKMKMNKLENHYDHHQSFERMVSVRFEW